MALPLSYTRCLKAEVWGKESTLANRAFNRAFDSASQNSDSNSPANLQLPMQWGVQDSNLRRHKPSDLQSDPFDRFGNPPGKGTPLVLSPTGNRNDRPLNSGQLPDLRLARPSPTRTHFSTAFNYFLTTAAEKLSLQG